MDNVCTCIRGTIFNRTLNQCQPCRPGTSHQIGDYRGRFPTGCIACPPGFFQPLAGQATCDACPAGQSSSAGAISCIACENGTIPLDRETRCGKCPPGYSHSTHFRSSGECFKCSQGQYKPEAGQSQCLMCPEGLTSPEGASRCGPLCPGDVLPLPDGTCALGTCPDGTAPLKSGTCGKCRPGTHYNATTQTCNQCGPNTFTNCQNLLGSCHICPDSEFALEGASECRSCPQGQVLIRNGKCVACGPGTWYDRSKLECRPCPANYFGPGGDQDMNELCTRCQEGSYAKPGSSECFYCPFGEAYDDTMKKCISSCSVGQFYFHQEARCRPCFSDSFKNVTGLQSCTTCPFRSSRGYLRSNENRTACVEYNID